jgi:transcriptional regulator with XRE-family HTH domain
MMGFPERLKRLRQERRFDFSELAKIVGIHSTQLRRYEKGDSQPTLDVLRKLAIALNVPGDELLFDEEERTPPEDFVLQFQSLAHLSKEERKAVRAMIDGLMIRQQAKKTIERE